MAKKSTPKKRGRQRPSSPSSPTQAPFPQDTTHPGLDARGRLDEATLRRFVFQTFGRARRTQDSPVMPDVWLRYIRVAEATAQALIHDNQSTMSEWVDLLLTPWSGDRAGDIAKRLRRQLQNGAASASEAKPDRRLAVARIAISDSRVVVCANFEMLVCHIVPLSNWWRNSLMPPASERKGSKREIVPQFKDAYWRIVNDLDRGPRNELARYLALVGFIDRLRAAKSSEEISKLAEMAHRLGPPPEDSEVESEDDQERKRIERELYERARDLLRQAKEDDVVDRKDADLISDVVDRKGIYLISLNRSASLTLFESRATVKADAVQRVFDINTKGLVVAVIDGGIDATHPAFLRQGDDDFTKFLASKRGKPLSRDDHVKWSRVKRTFDFTLLRDIVAHAENPDQIEGPNKTAIERLFKRFSKDKKGRLALEHLKTRSLNARDLDWEIVSPLIKIAHQEPIVEDGPAVQGGHSYRVPGTDHGTHVAGILAANLPEDPDSGRELIGMCPQLTLYDLRVFDAAGRGDEFAILCALEFVGWLNRDRANPVVHGVNLSLALAHDVDSFACGQTPICEACDHLVGAGTVVVAAAGNTGFEGSGPEAQSMGRGYRAISITDPGNADHVITVGSTHRRDPHLYGVSYFSARGPTGDGRRKPDLLAPGEKITSTIRDGRSQRMDGTSMAAPHVTGAAALLMARYPELIGRPLRIKEILMQTTTDLKREPSFQGAGLLDVLRALQSV
jgi:serine protease AprX